jgi:signal transduction histidine kinase
MAQADPNISWTEVTKFIGQLNHDLRNYLNAVELHAAFLGEIAEGPELKNEIKRLREMTGELGAHLHRLAHSLAAIEPNLMRYPAVEFIEDLRAKLALDQPERSATIEWQISLGGEALEIDPQLLQEAFVELLTNAGTHDRAEGALVFAAGRSDQTVEFTLCEPKTKFDGTTENWGGRPFRQMRNGHYGLGLFRARSIFEAHHGNLRAQFDPAGSVLRTTVSLPLLVS